MQSFISPVADARQCCRQLHRCSKDQKLLESGVAVGGKQTLPPETGGLTPANIDDNCAYASSTRRHYPLLRTPCTGWASAQQVYFQKPASALNLFDLVVMWG